MIIKSLVLCTVAKVEQVESRKEVSATDQRKKSYTSGHKSLNLIGGIFNLKCHSLENPKESR